MDWGELLSFLFNLAVVVLIGTMAALALIVAVLLFVDWGDPMPKAPKDAEPDADASEGWKRAMVQGHISIEEGRCLVEAGQMTLGDYKAAVQGAHDWKAL